VRNAAWQIFYVLKRYIQPYTAANFLRFEAVYTSLIFQTSVAHFYIQTLQLMRRQLVALRGDRIVADYATP
jgi:hypothetical protein